MDNTSARDNEPIVLKLLLVDDDEDVRITEQVAYESAGFNVFIAENGQQGIAMANEIHPDLIVSDILMPVMDGFEMCKQLKLDSKLKQIPLIFYTASYMDEPSEQLANALGANAYLRRPMPHDELIWKIREVLDRENTVEHLDLDRETIEILHRHTVSHKLTEKLHDLAENSKRDSLLLEYSPYGVLLIDDNEEILTANNKALSLFDAENIEQLQGRRLRNHMKPSANHACITDLNHLSNIEESYFFPECYIYSLKNTRHYVEVSSVPVPYQGKIMLHLSLRDIANERDMRRQMQLSSKVLDNTSEGVLITDADCHIVYTNKAFSQITGFTSEEVSNQVPSMFSSGLQDNLFYEKMWQSINSQGRWEGEIWNRRKNGEVYPEWLSITSIKDEDNRVMNYVGIFYDVSEQQALKTRLHFLAFHDVLTELPNRRMLLDRLNNSIDRADRDKSQIAVMFLDLDRFKSFNDAYGHTDGDILLQAITQRILQVTRKIDMVARLAGDEFVIVLDELNQSSHAVRVAEKLLQSFSEPFDISGRSYHANVSIGISLYPMDGLTAESLLKNADVAMYRAKKTTGTSYCFFVEAMGVSYLKMLELEHDLRDALECEELTVAYQPQISLSTGKMIGLEALARWEHPVHGTIGPETFIPIAEECGLIHMLGLFILNRALAESAEWFATQENELVIAVNLSGDQLLHKELIDQLKFICEKNHFDPENLELEITESVLMAHTEETEKVLEKLKKMRVRVSIDDFGTGYSSLAYLSQFPVDTLKIDRSFVSEIPDNKNDCEITSTVIAMAKNLNLKVIAEGVETREQMAFLQTKKCDTGQGYLFNRPLKADEISALLNKVWDI